MMALLLSAMMPSLASPAGVYGDNLRSHASPSRSIGRAQHVRPAAAAFSIYAPRASALVVTPVPPAAWERTPLQKAVDGSGLFTGDVSGMQPGDGYTIRVDGASRIDPSCPDVSVGSNHSIVPRPYRWQNARHATPLPRSVVYEMLVGSFTEEGTFAAAAGAATRRHLSYRYLFLRIMGGST